MEQILDFLVNGVRITGIPFLMLIIGIVIGSFVSNEAVRKALGIPADIKTVEYLLLLAQKTGIQLRVEIIDEAFQRKLLEREMKRNVQKDRDRSS